MRNFTHKVNQVLAGFCGWLMLAMMLLLVVDVVTRLIGQPMQGMAERSVFVMMVVIYLGLARCEELKEHVGLELLRNFLPATRRRALDWIGGLSGVQPLNLGLHELVQQTRGPRGKIGQEVKG